MEKQNVSYFLLIMWKMLLFLKIQTTNLTNKKATKKKKKRCFKQNQQMWKTFVCGLLINSPSIY